MRRRLAAGPVARRAAPFAVAALVLSGAGAMRVLNPFAGDLGPIDCPINALTGWDCPGCGSARAAHLVLNGEVAASLAYNPLLLPTVTVMAALWAGWALRAVGLRAARPRRVVLGGLVPLALGWGVLAFGVARNLPGLEVLAPGV